MSIAIFGTAPISCVAEYFEDRSFDMQARSVLRMVVAVTDSTLAVST